MPGKRGKKTKGQDKDVSFHFHSGGNSEKGAAYLSQGKNDSPVFSDEFEEDESGTETTSYIVTGTCEKDEEAVQELLESAIDDITSDKKYSEHPLENTSSEVKCKPQTDNNEHEKIEDPIETNNAKDLDCEGTVKHKHPPDAERFSDSDDFFSNKADERETTIRFNDNDRLLDSDDEELFFSLTKPPTSNSNITDVNEVDYGEVKSELNEDLMLVEKENLPIISVHDSCVSPSVLIDDLNEDSKALSEVDTHPLIPSELPQEGDEEEEQMSDNASQDTCDQELLMSEEHFTKVAKDQQPKVLLHSNVYKNVIKGKAPPPRPPPYLRKGPGVAVRSQDGTKMSPSSQGNDSYVAIKGSPLPSNSENLTKETGTLKPLLIEDANSSGKLDEEQISSEVCKDYSLSLRYFMIYVVIVFLYYSLNFSSYLAGFLTGFLFFFVTTAGSFIMYVKNLQTRQQQEREAIKKSRDTSSQELISQLGMDFDELSIMKVSNINSVQCSCFLCKNR